MRIPGLIAFVFLLGCGSSPPKGGGGGGGGGGGNNPDTVVDDTEPDTKPDPKPDTEAKPAAGKSLYARLGELPAITAVVDEFVNRTTADPRIKERFFNTDADNLKKLLTEFVCMATGGTCQYTGRDMASAHAGMDLVDDEFTALVENLIGALDKFKVPEKEKNELLGALGPLKPQIVVAPDKLSPIDAKKLAAVTKVADGLKDDAAKELLALAVTAGGRGQRSYAEQLFTRAEMLVGPKPLKKVAATFRAGAPPRVATDLKAMPADTAPQPSSIGSSDADDPDKTPSKATLEGKVLIDGKPPAGLGVVMLFPEKGKGKKRTPKQRAIEQRGKVFAPHVMAVPVGSTVSFPNFDNIFHNVFSLSKTKPFDLGMYKNGDMREVKFDKAGIVRLGCNLHASMSAYLIVVDAPHYVVVDSDGGFAFKHLAPGKYRAKAWSEASGDPIESKLEVKEGENKADIGLTAGAGPTLSPDKFGAPRQ